jgi:hypothetical protein
MEVSHEVPLTLLEGSRKFNDYDYALVHLLSRSFYREFFEESLKMGRRVILDNSMFELGEAFEMREFANAVFSLCPTEYVIPDVLGDSTETIHNMEKWNYWYRDKLIKKGCKSIGVAQGRDLEEILNCFEHMRYNTDKVALSFYSPWYEDHFPFLSREWACMYGRMLLVDILIERGYIKSNTKVHLLGCALPQEFRHYKGERYSFIETIDTSNPVVHGMKGIRYKSFGLDHKESDKLADLMDEELSAEARADVRYNINLFRKFVKYE